MRHGEQFLGHKFLRLAIVQIYVYCLFLTIKLSFMRPFTKVLFSAELKPRGYNLERFWQADVGYIGQAIIGVKIPNSSHVSSIQH